MNALIFEDEHQYWRLSADCVVIPAHEGVLSADLHHRVKTALDGGFVTSEFVGPKKFFPRKGTNGGECPTEHVPGAHFPHSEGKCPNQPPYEKLFPQKLVFALRADKPSPLVSHGSIDAAMGVIDAEADEKTAFWLLVNDKGVFTVRFGPALWRSHHDKHAPKKL